VDRAWGQMLPVHGTWNFGGWGGRSLSIRALSDTPDSLR
jgi:hypothetical protein